MLNYFLVYPKLLKAFNVAFSLAYHLAHSYIYMYMDKYIWI